MAARPTTSSPRTKAVAAFPSMASQWRPTFAPCLRYGLHTYQRHFAAPDVSQYPPALLAGESSCLRAPQSAFGNRESAGSPAAAAAKAAATAAISATTATGAATASYRDPAICPRRARYFCLTPLAI